MTASCIYLNESEIPKEFLCPITHDIMRDPLMARNGMTFERTAIQGWLESHGNTCPMTREPLKITDLIRHRALKAKIEAWREMHGVELGSSDFLTTESNILLTVHSSQMIRSTKQEASSSRTTSRLGRRRNLSSMITRAMRTLQKP